LGAGDACARARAAAAAARVRLWPRRRRPEEGSAKPPAARGSVCPAGVQTRPQGAARGRAPLRPASPPPARPVRTLSPHRRPQAPGARAPWRPRPQALHGAPAHSQTTPPRLSLVSPNQDEYSPLSRSWTSCRYVSGGRSTVLSAEISYHLIPHRVPKELAHAPLEALAVGGVRGGARRRLDGRAAECVLGLGLLGAGGGGGGV
jgi:hypothetical protein